MADKADKPVKSKCPGACAGDELTCEQVGTSAIWACSRCGRAWGAAEVAAANR